MQELVGAGAKAMTIAQFLNQYGRYDGRIGTLLFERSAKGYGLWHSHHRRVVDANRRHVRRIVRRPSRVKRFIFVGDPSQLPPIGAGRPFVDIIAKLRPADYETRFPRVAPGYANSLSSVDKSVQNARFSSRPLVQPCSAIGGRRRRVLRRCRRTSNNSVCRMAEARRLPREVVGRVVEELRLASASDIRGFNRALGAEPKGEYDYFNRTRDGNAGSVQAVDSWQILSPLRGMPFGVGDINRQIHERFRAAFIELASRQWRFNPKTARRGTNCVWR